MSTIDKAVQTALTETLRRYYDALKRGDMQLLSALMTEESYLITLEALGFKRAFKEPRFKRLLGTMEKDLHALKEVETILSANLEKESRSHQIEAGGFEPKGVDRITLHYREDGHPKKLYLSSSPGGWKIDYMAGRRKS